jgi:hypothetical protein
MRRRADGTYVCSECDEVVEIPLWAMPTAMFVQEPDGPRLRLLLVDGREIHRCEVEAEGPPRRL